MSCVHWSDLHVHYIIHCLVPRHSPLHAVYDNRFRKYAWMFVSVHRMEETGNESVTCMTLAFSLAEVWWHSLHVWFWFRSWLQPPGGYLYTRRWSILLHWQQWKGTLHDNVLYDVHIYMYSRMQCFCLTMSPVVPTGRYICTCINFVTRLLVYNTLRVCTFVYNVW